MRASFTVLIAAATFAVGGCSQTTSPTSPSAVAAASSASDTRVMLMTPPQAWAQLNRVTNLLVSANHQFSLFLAQGPPIIPPNPVIPGPPIFPADQNTLNFYVKANDVLDTVAISGPPITPQTTAELNAILTQANTTLARLLQTDSPRPSLLYGQIIAQSAHTTQVANTLLGF